uniref:Large ribosomal subunit protein mL53 n=1 Tax=Steinernema glaseri TaxID=37863 RepID=A0A1I7YDJ2_9BILA
MCKMWQKIRYGVRWNPSERLALANRGLNLKDVKSIEFSFDPFHTGNQSIREFLFNISAPAVKLTNPQLKVQTTVRNDRQAPFFVASLADGKKLKFKTDGMNSMDLTMRFNRLLGNPELGKAGTRIKTKI